MPYPIFPSLTRSPKYKSTRKLEDGTIADPAESGYVATRPRFSRQRRTFGATYENLCAEDVRALDVFEVDTVIGKAGAFYFPNLFPNGSFELPAAAGSGQLATGWTAAPTSFWSVTLSPNAGDGQQSVAFETTSAAGGALHAAWITCPALVPVTVGETYQVSANISIASTYATAGDVNLGVSAIVTYSDGSTGGPAVELVSGPTSGYQPVSVPFYIPSSTTGATGTAALLFSFVAVLQGSDPAATATILLDQVGLALITPVQAFGRMPGSAPLGTLVRFTKQPMTKDNTWAGGQNTYDTTFELTEV